MSALTSLARAEAVERGSAQPIASVRHLHLGERPMVFVPLTLAGEANAPLAAMLGADRDDPHLLVVPQPRNRDQRFAFAAGLAHLLVPYFDSFCGSIEHIPASRRGGDVRTRLADAPQVLVPNPGGIGFVRLFGRSTRFRRTFGPYAVDPAVPMLGRWLSFLAERAEYPGSSMLLAATSALSMHWASGQSPLEDANLAALLGWIDPPPDRTGAQAAAEAEDPLLWPPAGPATDPTFDNEVLAPAIAAYQRASDDPASAARAVEPIRAALRSQLEPTWHLMWHAIDLLRGLQPGQHVVERWAADRDAFTNFVTYLQDAGLPQPRRDSAVAAATRLHRLERAQASYDAQRALDDPLVMAEYRITGEAITGIVVATEPNRIDATGPRRKLRPHITVRTGDPLRLEPGTSVAAPTRPKQQGRIVSIADAADGPDLGVEVVLELSGGMGHSLTPSPGSVPEVGECLCYTSLIDTYQPVGSFPQREDTPWTHGGPPVSYVPTDEDATEEWS